MLLWSKIKYFNELIKKTKEEYLLKELLTASEDDFLKCQRELDKKCGFRHPNLV